MQDKYDQIPKQNSFIAHQFYQSIASIDQVLVLRMQRMDQIEHRAFVVMDEGKCLSM